MSVEARPIRIGILGTAAVVDYGLLEPAAACAEVEVVSIGSRDPRRARRYASEHLIPKATGYQGVIEDPEIDAVYVALPNSMHAEWSIAALRAGKHVLCEKPLALNAAEAARMAAVSEQTGRRLVEALHWRFHPLAATLAAMVNSGSTGRIKAVAVRFCYAARFLKERDIRLEFRLGGGILMDAGCYCVSLLRLLLGEPTTVRMARASGVTDQVERRMEAVLEFSDGAIGKILACNDLESESFDIRCEIDAEGGRVEVLNQFLPHLGGSITFVRDGCRTVQVLVKTPSYHFQLANFVRAIRDPSFHVPPPADSVRNMAVIDSIYRKAGLSLRGALPS